MSKREKKRDMKVARALYVLENMVKYGNGVQHFLDGEVVTSNIEYWEKHFNQGSKSFKKDYRDRNVPLFHYLFDVVDG